MAVGKGDILSLTHAYDAADVPDILDAITIAIARVGGEGEAVVDAAIYNTGHVTVGGFFVGIIRGETA